MNGLYKNRPLPGICLTISSIGKRFVTLQRPPPEIASFLPSLFPFSTSNTFFFVLQQRLQPLSLRDLHLSQLHHTYIETHFLFKLGILPIIHEVYIEGLLSH